TNTGNPKICIDQEAKKILCKLNDSDHLVIIDVNSKIISTEELSDKMQNRKFNNPNVEILIGGHDGIDQSINEIAK
ncbi:23S rRNA (pseudouridine(1915)-N(3))-methyltransferase RlmH, partial [Francisella tularensis subsp. holarctica]|uniref:23S rRNA (pseudouridine(1915)-N(3))-methyltransferase RlmH n=1 Tax=Francisella tularensis TaxID=263 RepID=UPI002381A7EE